MPLKIHIDYFEVLNYMYVCLFVQDGGWSPTMGKKDGPLPRTLSQ